VDPGFGAQEFVFIPSVLEDTTRDFPLLPILQWTFFELKEKPRLD
jgi:hypothetical protein